MKDTPSSASAAPDDAYRIATVSNLTGIPVQTIRVWESRYAAVQPTRSATNVRLYRQADIERLSLLKAAVDSGHAIGTVASLTDRQIKARFKFAPLGAVKTPERGCRVLVCGAVLAARLATAWGGRTDVRVQGVLPSLPDAESATATAVDAVIVEAAVLDPALPAALRQLQAATQARVAIVVYGFGNRQTLARLDDANVIALAAPADPAQLARICLLGLSIAPSAPDAFSQMLVHPVAPRRYDEALLDQLAQTPSRVQCECPNHVADLLVRLNAFALYSLECESSNTADASVHAMLYRASGHCREILEEALTRVMVHESTPPPKA